MPPTGELHNPTPDLLPGYVRQAQGWRCTVCSCVVDDAQWSATWRYMHLVAHLAHDKTTAGQA